jgi:hypothetical protein
MTLFAGTRLGPYDIVALLGVGTSFLALPAGEVWGEGRRGEVASSAGLFPRRGERRQAA